MASSLISLSISISQNAQQVLEDYPLAKYFASRSNLAFRNIIPGILISRAAKQNIG